MADKCNFILIKSFKTAINASRLAMLAIIWLDPATLRLHKLHSFMNIALSSYFKLWKLHTSGYFVLQFSYLFYLIVSSFYSLKTFDNRIEVIDIF